MELKNLLKRYGLWAKKSLGQHFLVDKNILNKIIEAAELTSKDIVLEIGPGIGILTKELCRRVKRVIVVEIDKKMVGVLKNVLKNVKNVEIVEGDILKLNPESYIPNSDYKIVANIPYQITSPLLERFLTAKNPPKEMVLMIQKEVAQKICSKSHFENRLSLFVKLYGTPKIISFVSKNCFWPRPKVDSAILKIRDVGIKTEELVKSHHLNPKTFLTLIKKGFSQKRKQLKNIFGEEILKNAGIMPQKRAEELTMEDWFKIYKEKENG